MSKERELLKRLAEGDNKGDFFISLELLKEVEAILAQPEQDKAEAVMPNGVCVSNVYDAYEEGRKSVMSEISLRDHFAGLAMQGVLVKEGIYWDDEKIALTAYEMADAMLAERGKRDDT